MSRPQASSSSKSQSQSPTGPGPQSPHSNGSPVEQEQIEESEPRSSASPNGRVSEASDGYPSWLPKRPLPPPPASTNQSSARSTPFPTGRKPTPRSIRIINMPDSARRVPTDQTRAGNRSAPFRAWSKATGPARASALFGSGNGAASALKPRFRTSAMHPELLESPSLWTRLQFYLLPLFIFAHIPLQTFFDFNAVFILLQVSKHPNPEAPGVSGSGRNWALGAAAYIACWAVWILVCVVYDLIYSFLRRWRVKRPAIFPLYLSSTAFNYVSMTSYTNFCFMRFIRSSAFSSETSSFRDGVAETFWFYSQNLPTVALLLPRAALCLALLFSFSSPQPGYVALVDMGAGFRDDTFFRASDGTLTNYSRGVLIANAAWVAWRTLVLMCSWIGLWVISGQACAGLCGPRYRWEEEEAEKRASMYSENASETDALPWNWREGTLMRVQEAYEFCLTIKPAGKWDGSRKEPVNFGELPHVASSPTFEGMEQVMTAVGLPSVPSPSRRGVLSNALFESPKDGGFPTVVPKAAKKPSQEKNMAGPSGPLMSLPYPFAGFKAQVSSEDQIPFPPSPGVQGQTAFNDDDDDDDEEIEEDEEGDGDELPAAESEEPSSQSQGCASGSMSSLGQPVSSRYPFHFRNPPHGNSISSAAASHLAPQSAMSHSARSRTSQSTTSTGNASSSEDGPRSPASSSMGPVSPVSSGFGSPIPMPPRHPQPIRGRPRAGTVPSMMSSSPSPTSIVFPRVSRPRAHAHTRTGSNLSQGFVADSEPGEVGDFEEGEQSLTLAEPPIVEVSRDQDEVEGEDDVGLLSPTHSVSPRGSFVGLVVRPSLSRRSQGSRSDSASSSSRSRASSFARSRTQSLIHSLGAASRSSLDLMHIMRSRTNSSMARLEEDDSSHSDAMSHVGSGHGSSNENYTFGQPLLIVPRESAEDHIEDLPVSRPDSPRHAPSMQSSLGVSSERHSQRTARADDIIEEPRGVTIYAPNLVPGQSMSDISTAAQSFVTAAATEEGTSGSSQRTASTLLHLPVDRHDGPIGPA